MRLLFSALGDVKRLSDINYQVPESDETYCSFISVVPLTDGYKPDETILVFPNSLLVYLKDSLVGLSNHSYVELIESEFLPELKKVIKERNLDEIIKEHTNKEPKFVIAFAKGTYLTNLESKELLKVRISSGRENLYTHLFFNIWNNISDTVLSFIKDPNDKELKFIVDITHGFNYITFYLAQIVREIAFIVGRLVDPTDAKKVSFKLVSYTPWQRNVDLLELIEIENIERIEEIAFFGFFDVMPSKKIEIINARLPKDIREIMDLLSEKMSLFIGSLLFGLPLHLVYCIHELEKLDPKDLIKKLMSHYEKSVKISFNEKEKTFEIFDTLKFTENFMNVVKGLVAFEILSVTNKIQYAEHIEEGYFDLELIKNIAVKTFQSERFSGRFYSIELEKLKNYDEIKNAKTNEKTLFMKPKGSSDEIRNFFAHSGLSSEAFYFYKDGERLYLKPNFNKTNCGVKFAEKIISKLLQRTKN